jgi:hypothetical protein
LLKISGTFIDEVSHDIPGQNWGRQEWQNEFDTFVRTGLDTVVLIRAGYGERLSFPSKTVAKAVPVLPVYADMVELFLEAADERDLNFYFGLYDSGYYWHRYDWKTEVDINREFAREAWDRYGHHAAFKGWYLPHETSRSNARIIDINTALAETVSQIATLPVLISPYWQGRSDDSVPSARRQPPSSSPQEHASQWDEIFAAFEGLVSYCAFQDGTAYEYDLDEFLRVSRQVAEAHHIELWTNVETFDRDLPIRFPPIEWRKLINKLTVAEPYVTKAITFEFSHFLSPNSMWPSARQLFDRYQEYLNGDFSQLT